MEEDELKNQIDGDPDPIGTEALRKLAVEEGGKDIVAKMRKLEAEIAGAVKGSEVKKALELQLQGLRQQVEHQADTQALEAERLKLEARAGVMKAKNELDDVFNRTK